MKDEILEAGEYCEKCLSGENLGVWQISETGALNICQTCFNEKSELRQWLVQEMEKALAQFPDTWKKLTDGRWQRIGSDNDNKQL